MSQLVIIALAALAVGGALGYFIGNYLIKRASNSIIVEAERKADQITAEAEKNAEIKLKESELKAKSEWLVAKTEFEQSTKERRSELERLEKRIREQEASVENKADMLRKREKNIDNYRKNLQTKEKSINTRQRELDDLIKKQNVQLERVAGMTSDEAKQILMQNLEAQARAEAAQRVKEIKDEAETKAEREAKQIIITAIQRVAADTTAEATVSVVSLPSDEIKGRIIGREGRNIRAFEIATGIDVIVDDTPEAIILSGYDPIRREIGRIAMEKLIIDGRIHPARIEETVQKAEKELEVIIKEAGEQACFEVGVHRIAPELVKLLGRLQYRTSYGQNVLNHSIEVAKICGLMAEELELDVRMAHRAGLLHDIGKAIDKGREGTHTELGYEVAKRHGEKEIVLNAIASHHEDVEATSPISILVAASDAVSGARPGARRETLENYIKRLEKLEQLAASFSGVQNSYAIQAGREIRVIVEPDRITDYDSDVLSADLASKIQEDLEYPGQIKVTVIREHRAVDYAK
ncbi:MAG: ribonuclease Y [Candidatus Zixiibacteriota bacterium]